MKPRVIFFIKVIIVLCFIIGVPKQVHAFASLSIDEGDYELLCTYNDGSKLTISKDDVYFSSSTLSATQSNDVKKSFKILDGQKNNYQNITEQNRCPSILYAYKLDAKYDDTNDAKGTYSLYYSNLLGAEEVIGGGTHNTFLLWGEKPNATLYPSENKYLVSEQISLLTTKKTTICDYKVKADSNVTSSRPMSIYLFENLTIAEVGGYYSSIDFKGNYSGFTNATGTVLQKCLDKEWDISINDPKPQSIIGGAGNKTNYVRFYIAPENTCKNENGGKACTTYEYIGTRNGETDDFTSETKVCEVLGGETVEQLRRIINILQILVPVLTIALTGFDLMKIVLSGNLDEELPKKKKVIAIRFVLMAFFFFLPFITSLLLGMLKDAGVIGVEQIDCITKEPKEG